MAYKAKTTKLSGKSFVAKTETADVEKSTPAWHKEKEKIITVILIVVMSIASLALTTLLFGFGDNWKAILVNPFILIIIASIVVLFTVKVITGETEINQISQLSKLILTVAIICFIATKIWTNKGDAISELFSVNQIQDEYGYGEYQISLSEGEGCYITFKQGLLFDYTISTDNCASDSLAIIYSDGSKVGSNSLLSIGRGSGRDARIKLVAQADLKKIKLLITRR